MTLFELLYRKLQSNFPTFVQMLSTHQTICVVEIMPPQWSEFLLTSHIPHGKLHIFVLYLFNIETCHPSPNLSLLYQRIVNTVLLYMDEIDFTTHSKLRVVKTHSERGLMNWVKHSSTWTEVPHSATKTLSVHSNLQFCHFISGYVSISPNLQHAKVLKKIPQYSELIPMVGTVERTSPMCSL